MPSRLDMRFGAIGDIHGDFDSLARIMSRHAEVPFWLSVGDVASNDGAYPEPLAPLYWIKGNNEDFDVIARLLGGESLHPNLRYLANGVAVTVEGVRVVGLGGTFAPTWFDRLATELPHARRAGTAGGTRKLGAARDDKRRHFVRDEVDACKRLREVDVFMSHEAPRPFLVTEPDARAGARRRGLEMGKVVINEVLATTRPRLHLFGHHHRFDDQMRQGIRSICLDLVSVSYLLIDAATLTCERVLA